MLFVNGTWFNNGEVASMAGVMDYTKLGADSCLGEFYSATT
jgi:hypothetical protein